MTLEENITYLANEAQQKLDMAAWLRKHADKFAALDGLSLSAYTSSIDFDHLTHEQVILVIKTFPAAWVKTPNGDGQSIDYETTFDGQRLRCWSGEPPPSCKIVEVEEFVPADVRKVFKIVCPSQDSDMSPP